MTSVRCVLLVAAALASIDMTAVGLDVGTAPGPVKLVTLDGDAIVMDNFDERPGTAVLFLSARCDATERAMADVNRLHEKYRLRGLLFVGVSSNPDESGDELRTFAQRRGMIFPVYRDANREAATLFGAQSTPEVFLLDRQGNLVFHGGVHDADARTALEAAMTALLRKQPVEITSHAVEGTPIDRPGPKREIDDPYGKLSFTSELVFEKIPGAAVHHCSTLCEAGNGDLLCLWYGGSYESADDQKLFLARRRPGQARWDDAQVLIENSVQPPGNGVIFRDASERLWIVWAHMEGSRPTRRGSGWGRCQLMVRTSADHGHTWSDDRRMFDETVWCVPRNGPARLRDGSLLLPVEGSLADVDGSHFLKLAPGATSWQRAGFTTGGSQPAVVERHDGSLLALMRHAPRITRIESRDGGDSWTDAVPTELANPDAGITMTRLRNGHLVLVFNDSPTKRTPLSIVRSTDEGQTWEKPLQLESNPGEYSYPFVIQTADDQIHVCYTFRRYAIKHVALNEDWLIHFERPD